MNIEALQPAKSGVKTVTIDVSEFFNDEHDKPQQPGSVVFTYQSPDATAFMRASKDATLLMRQFPKLTGLQDSLTNVAIMAGCHTAPMPTETPIGVLYCQWFTNPDPQSLTFYLTLTAKFFEAFPELKDVSQRIEAAKND